MTRFRNWLEETVLGSETGARLLFVHTGLSALIGLRIALVPFRDLAGLPRALFQPVAVLAWMGTMPSAQIILALQIVGALAAAAAVLRKQTRVAFAVAWLCYLVLAGLFGSRGKVMHNDLLLIWTAAPLLLAPVTVRWSDRTPTPGTGWAVRSATVIAALIYGLAGYHKLLRSGIGWAIGENMRYIMLWGPAYGHAPWAEAARWIGDRWWAYKSASIMILVFEVTFPLVLLWRRLQPFYAVVAVSLHLGTYVLLGLDYWAWIFTVLIVFIDWPALSDRLHGGAPPERDANSSTALGA